MTTSAGMGMAILSEPASRLGEDLMRTLWATLLLFGMMFAVGGALLLEWRLALGAGLIASIGGVLLRRAHRPAGLQTAAANGR